MKLFFLNSGQIEIKKKIFIPQITSDERFLLPVISTLIQYKNLNILFDTGCHPSVETNAEGRWGCLLYTSPSPRDRTRSRMPSSA